MLQGDRLEVSLPRSRKADERQGGNKGDKAATRVGQNKGFGSKTGSSSQVMTGRNEDESKGSSRIGPRPVPSLLSASSRLKAVQGAAVINQCVRWVRGDVTPRRLRRAAKLAEMLSRTPCCRQAFCVLSCSLFGRAAGREIRRRANGQADAALQTGGGCGRCAHAAATPDYLPDQRAWESGSPEGCVR